MSAEYHDFFAAEKIAVMVNFEFRDSEIDWLKFGRLIDSHRANLKKKHSESDCIITEMKAREPDVRFVWHDFKNTKYYTHELLWWKSESILYLESDRTGGDYIRKGGNPRCVIPSRPDGRKYVTQLFLDLNWGDYRLANRNEIPESFYDAKSAASDYPGNLKRMTPEHVKSCESLLTHCFDSEYVFRDVDFTERILWQGASTHWWEIDEMRTNFNKLELLRVSEIKRDLKESSNLFQLLGTATTIQEMAYADSN